MSIQDVLLGIFVLFGSCFISLYAIDLYVERKILRMRIEAHDRIRKWKAEFEAQREEEEAVRLKRQAEEESSRQWRVVRELAPELGSVMSAPTVGELKKALASESVSTYRLKLMEGKSTSSLPAYVPPYQTVVAADLNKLRSAADDIHLEQLVWNDDHPLQQLAFWCWLEELAPAAEQQCQFQRAEKRREALTQIASKSKDLTSTPATALPHF